jgi:hypothetical protein
MDGLYGSTIKWGLYEDELTYMSSEDNFRESATWKITIDGDSLLGIDTATDLDYSYLRSTITESNVGTQIIGTWVNENGDITFNADGTGIEHDYYAENTFNWSVYDNTIRSTDSNGNVEIAVVSINTLSIGIYEWTLDAG